MILCMTLYYQEIKGSPILKKGPLGPSADIATGSIPLTNAVVLIELPSEK